MDARLVQHVASPTLPRIRQTNMHRHRYSPRIVAVMIRPTENIERLTTTTKTEYNDNWFDRIAINHLSQSVQETIGLILHFYVYR